MFDATTIQTNNQHHILWMSVANVIVICNTKQIHWNPICTCIHVAATVIYGTSQKNMLVTVVNNCV